MRSIIAVSQCNGDSSALTSTETMHAFVFERENKLHDRATGKRSRVPWE